MLMCVSFHTGWHYLVALGSAGFYYGFLAIYCALKPGVAHAVGKSDNEYGVIFEARSARCADQSQISPK